MLIGCNALIDFRETHQLEALVSSGEMYNIICLSESPSDDRAASIVMDTWKHGLPHALLCLAYEEAIFEVGSISGIKYN